MRKLFLFLFFTFTYFFLFKVRKCKANYKNGNIAYNPNYNTDLSSINSINEKVETQKGKKKNLTKTILKGIGIFFMLATSINLILQNAVLNEELSNHKRREIDLTARLMNAERDVLTSKIEYSRKVEEMQNVINHMIVHTFNNK
ncbi:hypothetical protein PGAL8A_00516100 [Plasmodium gallinaceum]|uniref:Uncharacterized protein n=1 Tax=Plasmodium gallinaceum TaxID=5849 RepID=A0A1J1GYF2_PLAGA|nr:hypothetical protein PGAL8A_00516100 [Plasmodium gallinaceum]CRG97588.1 hypothetical protein PGAL8A_00516100 [Plasmodium gallinaceum]